MNARKQPPLSPDRQCASHIVADLMGSIRSSFYGDDPQWFKDQNFIFRNVVTWPASWLNSKGVTLPPERYKSMVLGVLMGVKQHGQTGAVKYWPGYLKHCLQTHFRINGEEIYNEGKAVRTKLEAVMGRVKPTEQAVVDPVEMLNEARKLASPPKRSQPKKNGQLKLL